MSATNATRRRRLWWVVAAVPLLAVTSVVGWRMTASPPDRPLAAIPPSSPAPAVSGVPSGSGSPLPSPTVGPKAGAATPGGSGASLRAVDGGTAYYARFSPSLPTRASFFPIGVWFESVLSSQDTARDRAAGINTYVELTANSDPAVVRASGMHAITSPITGYGTETAGWLVSDEMDMVAGPGSAAWTGGAGGSQCQPATASCGYSAQRTLRKRLPVDRRLRYANYGKGIAFWETRAEAARFVNEFQDVVSADTYWFTDRNICSASEGGQFFGNKPVPAPLCHRAANYGLTVDRVRGLVSPRGSKPVWSFIEVGHPFSENDWPSATPDQVVAAVWSSLIHGARGIIYFNHSFGGPCQTQHALREPCYAAMRAAVTRVNARVSALAPVLNAPTVTGVVSVGKGIDVAVKWHDGHFYLLAAATRAGAQTATFTMPCVGSATVTVLDEQRAIPVRSGSFRDSFARDGAVHLYRVDGGSSCGAY